MSAVQGHHILRRKVLLHRIERRARCTIFGRRRQAAATSANVGGYIGLTYWAAGPWWPDNYMFLAEPWQFPTGTDPAQLKLLKSCLTR